MTPDTIDKKRGLLEIQCQRNDAIEMKKIAASEFKAGVFKTTIGYSTVVSKSHSNRKSIHEFNPGHLIEKNYDSVALAINRYISKTKKTR